MAARCPQGDVDKPRTDQCLHGDGAQGRQAHCGDYTDGAAGCLHGGDDECQHGRAPIQCPQGRAPPGARDPRLPTSSKRPRRQRPFDFSQHGRRHVAVRLAYLGWGYQGFASQANTDNTVEAKLFQALLQTRLVESRQTANYHRSGRTDKGVSAFGQVVSLELRSRTRGPDGAELPGDELPYTRLLNRSLPRDVRALAWAPAPPGFSARFSCQHRTYRYLFPVLGLQLGRMVEAGRRLCGTHDFRNLCRMDVANGVVKFVRTVLRVRVWRAGNGLGCLEVRARSFLYHQVRCMAAVLLLVGRGLEELDVVDRLLDVESNPCKPQYSMAVDYPLVLHDCSYENLEWNFDPDVHAFTMGDLQAMWASYAIKTRILYSMLSGLGQAPNPQDPEDEEEEDDDEESALTAWGCTQPIFTDLSQSLLEGVRPRKYKPLMERQRCEGLESRIRHYVKRGRITLPEEMRETEGQQHPVDSWHPVDPEENERQRDHVELQSEGQQGPTEPLEQEGQRDLAESQEQEGQQGAVEARRQQDPAEHKEQDRRWDYREPSEKHRRREPADLMHADKQ
ncbi:tRNA pseudouridine(38/39) synthase [Rhinoraja longicauda]